MRSFTLYGLEGNERIVAVEQVSAEDLDAARAIARARLAEFPKVELWEGSVCIARKAREQQSPPTIS